ncbi:hypothetical protein EV694_2053 [Volucribacter psittacicida]|uniref:DUF8095 domain-containing protein n=1 Tax=Volucribacter psittacicida TaxID=203482 RepID=A0A4R1FN92_9PAST|nr:hypothetical protein [Volucribacter psittacicida]TCJ94819.1 hypothetical protein EV694_2053 [Volucribacter psittacicida]
MLKKLTALSLAMGLMACTTTQSELKWITYKDINGNRQALTFTQQAKTDLQQPQGEALQQKVFGNPTEYVSLGDIYLLEVGSNQYIRIILQQGQQSINPYDKTALAQLGKAKQFEVYQFSQGRISHSRFSAEQGICHSFQRKKQGVRLEASSNYYATSKQFVTSLISATLNQKQDPTLLNYRSEFNLNDPHLRQQIEQDEKQQGNQTALNYAKQQASLLRNVVCFLLIK